MKLSTQFIAIFIQLLFFITQSQAQQTIPEGTKFGLITDLNRWVTVCKDCQVLKYPEINLTLTSNTDASSRNPNEASLLIAEHQDGKIRLRTCYNTYVSVCGDCRKSGPSYLLTASTKIGSNGKVPPEALFDFIPVENSCFYMIRAYTGNYVTRYHPGGHRPDMLKGKSQVMAAYYGRTDRRAGKFEIIVDSLPFSKEYVAGVNPPQAVRHDIVGRNWINTAKGSDSHTGVSYVIKKSVNLKSIFPSRNCETGSNCQVNVLATQPSSNLIRLDQTGNTNNLKFNIEYLGDDKGYRIKDYESKVVLSVMDAPNKNPCDNNMKGKMVSFRAWKENERNFQLWNIEQKCDNFYLIQSRSSGLYLGQIFDEETNFVNYVLVDKKDAIEFGFEKIVNGELPANIDKGYTFKFIDVPGTNEMIANPSLLQLLTWEETTSNNISTTSYSYEGYNDWQVATFEKAEKITQNFKGSCQSYLEILSTPSRYYYYDAINSNSWRPNLLIIKQLSISQKGNVSEYSGILGENDFIYNKAKVLLWRNK